MVRFKIICIRMLIKGIWGLIRIIRMGKTLFGFRKDTK